jgi:hypothetical protein
MNDGPTRIFFLINASSNWKKILYSDPSMIHLRPLYRYYKDPRGKNKNHIAIKYTGMYPINTNTSHHCISLWVWLVIFSLLASRLQYRLRYSAVVSTHSRKCWMGLNRNPHWNKSGLRVTLSYLRRPLLSYWRTVPHGHGPQGLHGLLRIYKHKSSLH